MAFTYGFYNSYEGDRKYNAEQMSAIFDGIINDGIFASIGEIFATIPGDGLQVIVKTGRGWLAKTWFYNDNYYPLNLDEADLTLPRLDAIVVEVDKSIPARKSSLKVVKGTPRSTPEKPALTNDGTIFQMPLSYVRVEPSATSIQASGIDIRVGMTDCPFVTGIIETADITDLFQGWDEDFHTWWDTVSSVLNEDTVGQLQLQIDQLKNGKADKTVTDSLQTQVNGKLNISAKATESQIAGGTNDSTYVTPKGLASGVGVLKSPSGETITSEGFGTYNMSLKKYTQVLPTAFGSMPFNSAKIVQSSTSGSSSLNNGSGFVSDGTIVTKDGEYAIRVAHEYDTINGSTSSLGIYVSSYRISDCKLITELPVRTMNVGSVYKYPYIVSTSSVGIMNYVVPTKVQNGVFYLFTGNSSSSLRALKYTVSSSGVVAYSGTFTFTPPTLDSSMILYNESIISTSDYRYIPILFYKYVSGSEYSTLLYLIDTSGSTASSSAILVSNAYPSTYYSDYYKNGARYAISTNTNVWVCAFGKTTSGYINYVARITGTSSISPVLNSTYTSIPSQSYYAMAYDKSANQILIIGNTNIMRYNADTGSKVSTESVSPSSDLKDKMYLGMSYGGLDYVPEYGFIGTGEATGFVFDLKTQKLISNSTSIFNSEEGQKISMSMFAMTNIDGKPCIGGPSTISRQTFRRFSGGSASTNIQYNAQLFNYQICVPPYGFCPNVYGDTVNYYLPDSGFGIFKKKG